MRANGAAKIKVIEIVPRQGDDLGLSVALQTNDKIIVVGFSATQDGSEIAVLRYNSNGSLDSTFNGTGIRTTTFRTYAHGDSVTLQPDGKIVVAGRSSTESDSDFAVVRYMGGM